MKIESSIYALLQRANTWTAAQTFNAAVTIDGDLTFTGPQAISTTEGDLTLSAAANADVLIGDGTTLIGIDGSTGHIGIGESFNTTIIQLNLNMSAFTYGGTATFYRYFFGGDNVITTTGSGAKVVGTEFREPNITVSSGSVATASTVRIFNAPSEGTNNWALLVDSGKVRIDDQIQVGFEDSTPTVSATGSILSAGGIAIGADALNNLFDNASGGTGTVVMYIGNQSIDTTASDVRLKTNWSPPNGLAREHLTLLAESLEEYDYVPGTLSGARFIGHGAQHLYKTLPQYVVKGEGESNWSVNYRYMVGPLIWGWQEHETRFSTVEDRLGAVQAMRQEITQLRAQVAALEGA